MTLIESNMKRRGVIVSGYFNPVHKGHIEYFNNAKGFADDLFVIVNNDHQRALKGSKEFQGEEERIIIVSNIKVVDQAILSKEANYIFRRHYLVWVLAHWHILQAHSILL